MVDHDNLEKSSAIGVTAVCLSIATAVTLMQVHWFYKNLKYREAQIRCMLIFLGPLFIGWSSWTCFFVGEEIKIVESLIQWIKGISL